MERLYSVLVEGRGERMGVEKRKQQLIRKGKLSFGTNELNYTECPPTSR